MRTGATWIAVFFGVAIGVGAVVARPADEVQQLRERARYLRQEAQAQFERAQQECRQQFLVNHCLDKAHAARLELLQEARRLEIESRRLERQARAGGKR